MNILVMTAAMQVEIVTPKMKRVLPVIFPRRINCNIIEEISLLEKSGYWRIQTTLS